jgi:hypothetical protein
MKLLFLILIMTVFSACASGSIFTNLFGIKAADSIPVTAKAKAKVEATGQIGQTNKIEKTQAGHDVNNTSNNDTGLMAKTMRYWYIICGMLILYIGRMEFHNAKLFNRYINILEKIAFTRRGDNNEARD